MTEANNRAANEVARVSSVPVPNTPLSESAPSD